MATPELETLDEICVLITGDDDAEFKNVKEPEQRVEIIRLALLAEQNETLDWISDHLKEVGQWFKNSKVYWP